MKKISSSIMTAITLVALSFVGFNNSSQAAQLTFYPFPASVINDQNSLFYLARATYMNGLAMHGGAPIETSSRLNNPPGIEIKPFFLASDLMVVDPSVTTNTLFMGQLNPSNTNYAGQIGQRGYVGGIFVANNSGKITLDGLSTSIIDAKGFLDNQSTLAGEGYSISRVGVTNGPSGNLFGNDHGFITSGSGSQPVDAIVFIGARVGFDVSQYGQKGIDAVESYIGAGDTLKYIYTYTWTNEANQSVSEDYSYTVPVYQDGATNYWGMTYWLTPRANTRLFSLVEPPTNTYSTWICLSAPQYGLPTTNGPGTNVTWTLNNTSATTGWSYEDPSFPPHDAVFVSSVQNSNALATTGNAIVHSQPRLERSFEDLSDDMSLTNFFKPSY